MEDTVRKVRQGRTVSKAKDKVFTPTINKLGDNSYQVIVPFNDSQGNRVNKTLVLVSAKDKLVISGN